MIYIASPFTSDNVFEMENRFNINAQFTAKLIRNYIDCFNPIVYGWGFYSNQLLPNDPKIWSFVNHNFMRKSDNLLVLELRGWENSKGVFNEIDYFTRYKKPINYMPEVDVWDIISGKEFELFINHENEIEWRFL